MEELRIFDLVATIKKLGEVIDLSKLGSVVDAVKPIFDDNPPLDSVDNVEKRIKEFLVAAKAVVEVTKTETDDNVLDTINALLLDANLQRPLAQLMFYFLSKKDDVGENEVLPMFNFDWKNLDWETILKVVKLLVGLWTSSRG